MKLQIIAADRIMDGQGCHTRTEHILSVAKRRGLSISSLEIVSLATRWEDKLSANQFKSGASAMAALEKARKLIKSGKTSVVVIKGVDHLKTGYSRAEREKFMKLYAGKYTPMDGYNRLVDAFNTYHGISGKKFLELADALFKNYTRTWLELDPKNTLPEERWFAFVSKYFRGVDCANPNIDYSGQVIVTSNTVGDLLKIPKKERVTILGNAFTKLAVDGFESIPKVAPYLHLKRTIHKAIKEAQIDFKLEFFKKKALMEAYTCYPVVPMGLLLRLGIVKNLQELPDFLSTHEITVTGGLNLARAPWNLTSLNYLIAMREKLISSKKYKYGLVHGNGSLGNQQGITILAK